MKKVAIKMLMILGMIVSALAFTMAQGSFLFWKQPRVPKHLKNTDERDC